MCTYAFWQLQTTSKLARYRRAPRIGNQLFESIVSMPMLRKLTLASEECCEQENLAVWSIFSRCPAIQTLEELAIHNFAMCMHDFTISIIKHKSTLRKLQIGDIQWTDGAPSVLGWFYGELSKAPHLEEVEQHNCFFMSDPGGVLHIPKHLLRPWSEVYEDEGEYIWVHRPGTDIHYKGKDKVKKVLEECAASIQST